MTLGFLSTRPLGRRRWIGFAAAGAGLLALGWPRSQALAATAEANALLNRLTRNGQAKSGKVTLNLPYIAENGATVPFTVSVESPMTEADHVKTITVVSEENPSPQVVEITLGPAAGKAEVQLRIRLASSQRVVAVAEMSDGSLWMGARELEVMIGGCG